MWPALDAARSSLLHGRGRGIRVAVLDSGVEFAHPALTDATVADDVAVIEEEGQLRTVPGGNQDTYGHGTAVAGIIHRLAPEATLGSFRVLGPHLRSRTMIIREAARLALARGYHILNCSFGCGREDHVLYYKDWIDDAYLLDRHVVAACNNQDYTRREWPGHFPTVITVNFARSEIPEFLRRLRGRLVEFEARGQDIEVPWLGGTQKLVTGSSFAAPHVTGLLARLVSNMPNLSSLTAKSILHALATDEVSTASKL